MRKIKISYKQEVKTDERTIDNNITRGQISHFRTEFYDDILKVWEFTFDDIIKTLIVLSQAYSAKLAASLEDDARDQGRLMVTKPTTGTTIMVTIAMM